MSDMDDFSFVDAHHHLWDLNRLYYAWLTDQPVEGHPSGDLSEIRKDYLPEDFKKDGSAVNLIKSVHVETATGESDPVRETAWLQEVADKFGFPNGIIARTDLRAPNVSEQLDRHLAYRNFRGIRMISFTGPDFFEAPDFRRGFAVLQNRDLIFDMDADWRQMGKAFDLARSFPRATIILGHCGFPKQRTVPYFHEWRKAIRQLAQAENVACKLSGLAMVDHKWTVETIKPWIETCIEAFGPHRCMFGTNWPVDALSSDYPTLVNAYREIVADHSRSEQRQMFRATAEGWYRI